MSSGKQLKSTEQTLDYYLCENEPNEIRMRRYNDIRQTVLCFLFLVIFVCLFFFCLF